MRASSLLSHLRFTASVAALAVVALAGMPAQALAQDTTAPPGAPESSQQDDDATASPEQDTDAAATAAESAAPLETGTGDNIITVTGSRIARPEFSFPNPVQAYTSETIQQAGTTNLTDFLIDSPALRGSTTNVDTAGSNLPNAQYVGVNLLDLRYLGEERTLVLVNGRRHIAGYPGIASVDINTIPVDLIDRIDVLTGGTSAIYGADGVSGVVNFVMKRDFEGLSVRAQGAISQRGDAGNRFVSATWGHNMADGRANVAVSYEFNQLDRFSQRKRLNYGMTGPTFRFVRNPADFPDTLAQPDQIPLSGLRWADSSPGGAIDLDGDGFVDFTGEGTPYDVGTYVKGSSFTIGGDSTPQESYFGDYTPYSRRHIFNAFGHFEFSPAARLFFEAKYVNAAGATYAQPTYDFFTYLAPDNAYLNQRFGSQIAAIEAACDPADAPCFTGSYIAGRDNFDFGIRRYSTKRDTYRAVAGLDGKLSDHLRYELSYTFGQVESTGTNQGDRLTDRYFAALDAVVNPATGQVTCRINLPGETEIQGFSFTPEFLTGTMAPVSFQPGQCIPLNVLGENSPSAAALNWIIATHTDHARIRHHVLSGYVSGDTGSFFKLPGGPVGFALGGEYRRESSRIVPSDVSIQGLTSDNAQQSITTGHFSVKEAFAEINIPILSDLPFADTLSVGGAYRLSDYTTVGTTQTWSVNGVYAPVRDILFRGTYSQAVRAPNVSELFGGDSGTFEFIADPCGIDRLTSGTSTRAANCAAALTALGIDPTTFDPANDPISPQNSSILGSTGGNPGLGEETAKTWTAGLVLKPRFIPGLNIALDWYDIRLKNAVNTPTAQELVELCYDQPTLENVYCDAVGRSGLNGYINDYHVGPENVANFDTEGLDIAFNYRFAPFSNFGTFNLKVNGNYLHKLEFIPTPGAEIDDDRTEFNRPKYSATADLTWTKGPLTLNYGINWFSHTRRSVKELTDANPDRFEDRYKWYKEYWEHQFQVAYNVDNRMNIYAGVNNLLDTKGSVGVAGYPNSAVGRFFYVGVRLKPF
jgi:outer membrane receptor protein involved in Fe transport